MDSGKIFWMLAVVAAAGLFIFVALGGLVSPSGSPTNLLPGGTNKGSGDSTGSGGVQAKLGADGVQEVQLSFKNGNYYPQEVRVKKDKPVRMVVDLGSVTGCMRTILIPEFGVRKNVREGDNNIEFTPQKSGTFGFSCGMGMGTGKIVVEESDGRVATYAGSAPKLAAGGSCGMGGGCGCGG